VDRWELAIFGVVFIFIGIASLITGRFPWHGLVVTGSQATVVGVMCIFVGICAMLLVLFPKRRK